MTRKYDNQCYQEVFINQYKFDCSQSMCLSFQMNYGRFEAHPNIFREQARLMTKNWPSILKPSSQTMFKTPIAHTGLERGGPTIWLKSRKPIGYEKYGTGCCENKFENLDWNDDDNKIRCSSWLENPYKKIKSHCYFFIKTSIIITKFKPDWHPYLNPLNPLT